jgi:hypothetical protein
MAMFFLLNASVALTLGLTGAANEFSRLCRREAYRRPVEPFVKRGRNGRTDL